MDTKPLTTHAHGYRAGLLLACLAALALPVFSDADRLPVLGTVPLWPVTVAAALIGWGALAFITRGPLSRHPVRPLSRQTASRVALAGAALALPPVAIDLILPFARDINLPLPGALAFYPAIALVAETTFHLVPLAILSLLLPRGAPPFRVLAPVALIEPLFQVAILPGAPVQGWLVLANVGLISAAQMWVFLRHGFGAMLALRLAFYLTWHVIWGTLRLQVLV